MALITCTECHNKISDKSEKCIHCGAPIERVQTWGMYRNYTQQETLALLSRKRKTSHLLHLVLTVFTCGLWLIIWILVAISNSIENRKIENQLKKGKKIK